MIGKAVIIPIRTITPEISVRTNPSLLDLAVADIGLGGTISGEHGTGLTKMDHVADQIGPAEMDIMHRIKQVFDPKGIMNPGKGW